MHTDRYLYKQGFSNRWVCVTHQKVVLTNKKRGGKVTENEISYRGKACGGLLGAVLGEVCACPTRYFWWEKHWLFSVGDLSHDL